MPRITFTEQQYRDSRIALHLGSLGLNGPFLVTNREVFSCASEITHLTSLQISPMSNDHKCASQQQSWTTSETRIGCHQWTWKGLRHTQGALPWFSFIFRTWHIWSSHGNNDHLCSNIQIRHVFFYRMQSICRVPSQQQAGNWPQMEIRVLTQPQRHICTRPK